MMMASNNAVADAAHPEANSATTSTPEPHSTSSSTSYKPFLPSPFTHTNPAPELITQGAEALLYKTHFLDPSTPAALKVRPSKPYRHPTLDARLTKQRVLAEARVLVKLGGVASLDVNVPAVLSLEWDISRRVKGLDTAQRGDRGGGAWLMMEWIDGLSVKELLRAWDLRVKKGRTGLGVDAGVENEDQTAKEEVENEEEVKLKKLLRRIGRAVGAMHSAGGVVHGDLTTSNIMIRPTPTDTPMSNGNVEKDLYPPPSMDGDIVLIDFGLAMQSIQDEDRAVDLYVLERAFGSTHPRQEGWFDAEVLQSQEGYRGSFKGASVVLKRLEEVRLRGRKRSMIG